MHTLLPLIALVLFSACDTGGKETVVEISGFDYTRRTITELQPPLNEISGIAYDRNRNTFFAVNDEQGTLFVLNPGDFTIQKELKFGKKGDYECVATNGEQIFVLKSNGDISSIQYDGEQILQARLSAYSGPSSEFESCLWDGKNAWLRLISKKSATDKELQANQIYHFDPASNSYAADGEHSLSWADLRKSGYNIKSFHPSGAATEPVSGNIYVVSSIEKLLVIFSPDWKLLSAHELDERIFRQPEGVCFDKEGNLLITNEAAGGRPNLIVIPTKK